MLEPQRNASRRGASVLALLVAVVASIACHGDKPKPKATEQTEPTLRGFPVFGRMTLVDFYGTETVVTREGDIDAAVPWPIVIPGKLPAGFGGVGLVQVEVPPSDLPPDAAARRTRVMMTFGQGPRGPGFTLTLNGGLVDVDSSEAASVKAYPAQFAVNAVGAQPLAWDFCGRTLILQALESAVPKAELFSVAESVPARCE